jgi:hypothetical protein
MSAYWSTATGIESFDAELAHRQVGVVTQLTEELMEAELAAIARRRTAAARRFTASHAGLDVPPPSVALGARAFRGRETSPWLRTF